VLLRKKETQEAQKGLGRGCSIIICSWRGEREGNKKTLHTHTHTHIHTHLVWVQGEAEKKGEAKGSLCVASFFNSTRLSVCCWYSCSSLPSLCVVCVLLCVYACERAFSLFSVFVVSAVGVW